MNRLTDETLVFCLCLPVLGWAFQGWASIVAILVAAICLVTFELVGTAAVRTVVAAALALACALLGCLSPFMPLAAYLCMAQRQWAVRCLWLACWCVLAWQLGFALAGMTLLEGAVASVLAVRTARQDESTRALRESRDAIKENLIELLEREDADAATTPGDVDGTTPAGSKSASAANAGEGTDGESRERLLRFSDLTERENTVVSLIAEGCENKEIAARLYLSEGTVRNVVSSILQKKQLANRTQIAIMYYRD